jgi:hypothetical protein
LPDGYASRARTDRENAISFAKGRRKKEPPNGGSKF